MLNFKSLLISTLSLPFKAIDILFNLYCRILSLPKESLSYLWLEFQKDNLVKTITTIKHENHDGELSLKFFTPNAMTYMRAKTFSSKEPETIKWIDEFSDNSIMFDVGANVGIYSIYSAKSKGNKVYAFEPSVFNLALLAKNIHLNNVDDLIKIVPNPLSEKNGFADFKLSSVDEGAALSAFGVDYGCDGEKIGDLVSYQVFGFSMDYMLENKIIHDFPNMIKIDVDGIEHIILRGAINTLTDDRCRTVLVEINDNFSQQSTEATEILKSCGFSLKEKQQSPDLRDSDQYNGLHNQIWVK